MYFPSHESFSTNLASLSAIIQTLDINNDPYVLDLQIKLANSAYGSPDYHKYDQKLSKVMQKHDSFTHKGLRDFERTTDDICMELGAWAADWFVWSVIDRAKQAANPSNNMMPSWKVSEKAYLLSVLEKVEVTPVSYYPDDIADDCSDKAKVLIDCLMLEKAETESLNDVYSCIVFVQRRDTVLALAELIKHHPHSKGLFNIGVLLGTSESSRRHSMMDITRDLGKDSQEDTLSDFKDGEKNLIVSTAVAEEGIDIQACGGVIRWDPPHNMASWAQSRGRARKRRSTFTVMFEEGTQNGVAKWEALERQMVEKIYDPLRNVVLANDNILVEDDEENDDRVYEVASTGSVFQTSTFFDRKHFLIPLL
jgi:superfamily II DNA/RNA helicase